MATGVGGDRLITLHPQLGSRKQEVELGGETTRPLQNDLCLLQQGSASLNLLNLPKQSHQLGPSVQIHVPMGGGHFTFKLQYHYMKIILKPCSS